MCACARGAVALCPASPGCRHMVSGKVKLQTAAFSVALKDGVSLGGTLGMCVVEFVQRQREASLQENRLSIVFLDYLQCGLSAADKRIRLRAALSVALLRAILCLSNVKVHYVVLWKNWLS